MGMDKTGNNDADTQVKIKLISDEPTLKTVLGFEKYSNLLANIIENSKSKFTIGVLGDWGTGKSTLMRMIQNKIEENEMRKPDENKKILTVWFDAWKYEREEHLAVIPFLRTIRIALEESQKSKIKKWERIKKGLDLCLNAFINSTKVTYGIKDVISVETDFAKLADYRNADSLIGDKTNILYYDANLFLDKTLKDVRRLADGNVDDEFRIVVFVDDLDRCSPEKALEVLESIKTFFDIEGFVFVVGMNYKSINAFVKKKYIENPDIKGSEYIRKIVQLPFRIPSWDAVDADEMIDLIISQYLDGSDIAEEFQNNKEILVRGLFSSPTIKSNPREMKRALNKIILAKTIYNVPINILVVVSSLVSRPKWSKFVESIIMNDERRPRFLKLYSEFFNTVEKKDERFNLIKEQLDKYVYPEFSRDFPDFFERDYDLHYFLRDRYTIKILLECASIERIRRMLNTVDLWIDDEVVKGMA